MQNICPQCNCTLKSPSCRLIQDTCGHYKCRLCLLKDEDNCSLCVNDNTKDDTKNHSSVIKYENSHTAVITYKSSSDINGNANDEKADDIKQENIELNKRFYQTLPIPNHISASNEVPIVYTCKICGRQFKTRSHIKYHQYCISG